jgi:hypothetical protein
MTVDYEFTREDYVRWAHELTQDPRVQEQWRAYRNTTSQLLVLAIFLALLVVGTTIMATSARAGLPAHIPLMAISIALGWLLLTVRQRLQAGDETRIGLEVERCADDPHAVVLRGTQRIEVSPEAMRWVCHISDARLSWRRIGRVEVKGSTIEVQIGTPEVRYPVPVRAFVSSEDVQMFVQLISKYRDAAEGEIGNVAAKLRDRSYECPGCGYDLRGIKDAVCPECGREVVYAEVTR